MKAKTILNAAFMTAGNIDCPTCGSLFRDVRCEMGTGVNDYQSIECKDAWHDANTPQTVGNQFGHLCPHCDKGDALYISFVGTCRLTPDGSDDVGDHEWDDESAVTCRHCSWSGFIRNLVVADNFEEE